MASTTGVASGAPGHAQAADAVRLHPAPPELAALEAERTEKRNLLDLAAETAVEDPRGVSLPAGTSADGVPPLPQRYYWSEPAAEGPGHDPAELARPAPRHPRLAEGRAGGGGSAGAPRA